MTAFAATSTPTPTSPRPLQPLPFWPATILFGVPALAMALAVYGLWPALTALGIPRTEGRYYSSLAVMISLLLAALVGYVWEGQPLTWRAFAQRLRLTNPGWRFWPWAVGGLLVMGVLSLAANNLLPQIWRALRFTPPEAYVEDAPALWLTLITLIFNVLGEELWWRGYILPRQELAHGQWTWVLNGVLWALFHLYKWWVVPAMLITCLVVPFVCQRVKSTWPGIFIHFGLNGLGLLLSALSR